MFRYQVLKNSRSTFHWNDMEGIENLMEKHYTWVFALVMFYKTKTNNPIKVYRLLSCVLYYFIENYVCIDYVCCHSRTLSVIASDKIFKEASYKWLLGISIPKLLMNLVYFHGFTKRPHSTVILVCWYRLVNCYLSKCFVIIEHNSKQLSIVPDDVKIRIHAIYKQKTDYVMACITAISSVASTKNKLYVQYTFYFI